jgi:hypothetical protein
MERFDCVWMSATKSLLVLSWCYALLMLLSWPLTLILWTQEWGLEFRKDFHNLRGLIPMLGHKIVFLTATISETDVQALFGQTYYALPDEIVDRVAVPYSHRNQLLVSVCLVVYGLCSDFIPTQLPMLYTDTMYFTPRPLLLDNLSFSLPRCGCVLSFTLFSPLLGGSPCCWEGFSC